MTLLNPTVSDPVKKDLSKVFCGAAIFLLLMVAIVGLGPLTVQKAAKSSGDGNVLRQFVYIAIFFFVLCAARVDRQVAILVRVPVEIVLILLWCWVSMLWAIEPSIAIRRLLLTTLIIWTTFIAVDRAGYDHALRVMRAAFLVILVGNYLAIAVLPSAVHQVAELVDPGLVGDWRGLLPQKNFAGAICAFTIITYCFSRDRIPLLLRGAVLLASAYFLYRSGSRTSLFMGGVAMVCGAAQLHYDPRYRALIPPFLVIALSGGAIMAQSLAPGSLSFIINDQFLTGRAKIWDVLARYSSDHYWFGSGYGSFWNIGQDSPVYAYTNSWVRGLGNGHNGYIDLLTQIGVPGLVVAIIAMVVFPFGRLLSSKNIDKFTRANLTALLVFCALHNLTESSILDRDAIVQVLLAMTLALIFISTKNPAASAPGDVYWGWIRPFPKAPVDPVDAVAEGSMQRGAT